MDTDTDTDKKLWASADFDAALIEAWTLAGRPAGYEPNGFGELCTSADGSPIWTGRDLYGLHSFTLMPDAVRFGPLDEAVAWAVVLLEWDALAGPEAEPEPAAGPGPWPMEVVLPADGPKGTPVADLDPGQCFLAGGKLYVRVALSHGFEWRGAGGPKSYAVGLPEGEVWALDADRRVMPVRAKCEVNHGTGCFR